MRRNIAILRGINVGGHRKILMADLKSMFSMLGFTKIITYIQSGNVIFGSDEKISVSELSDKIENAINEKYGFDVPVIINMADELKKAVSKNPFLIDDEVNIDRLFMTYLKNAPSAELILKIEKFDFSPDKFVIEGRHIYLYCEGKYHKSKLTNNFFESRLNTSVTTRNWKTVLKLLELSN